MSLLKRLGIFALVGTTSYAGLSRVFGLYCMISGHNSFEMLYGGAATFILALAPGAEFAWLASYPANRAADASIDD